MAGLDLKSRGFRSLVLLAALLAFAGLILLPHFHERSTGDTCVVCQLHHSPATTASAAFVLQVRMEDAGAIVRAYSQPNPSPLEFSLYSRPPPFLS